jgi:hypothetical protein
MVSPTPRSSGEAKFSGTIFTHLTHWRPQIISEFYHLRRTAIKDLAAYIGFLTGFIGAAPFAWGLLSDQLASGSFVRGLWYFFGIVIASGLFTGTAGLGLGYAAGILWEQFHRHRRRENVKAKTFPEEQRTQRTELVQAPSPIQPRLQLVSLDSPDLPTIDGRVMRSVQFRSQSIELDFGGIRLSVMGNPVTVCRGQRFRYPDPGARDALCALIGDRVSSVRSPSADRVDVLFDSGCELVMLRSSVAVA